MAENKKSFHGGDSDPVGARYDNALYRLRELARENCEVAWAESWARNLLDVSDQGTARTNREPADEAFLREIVIPIHEYYRQLLNAHRSNEAYELFHNLNAKLKKYKEECSKYFYAASLLRAIFATCRSQADRKGKDTLVGGIQENQELLRQGMPSFCLADSSDYLMIAIIPDLINKPLPVGFQPSVELLKSMTWQEALRLKGKGDQKYEDLGNQYDPDVAVKYLQFYILDRALKVYQESLRVEALAPVEEDAETVAEVAADFVERLEALNTILRADKIQKVTSWPKAHKAIQLLNDPPEWIEMITPNALSRCIREGIMQLREWESWPAKHKGFKRSRVLISEVWNENRENWEKD